MIKTGITTPDGIWLPITPSIDDDDWRDRYRDYDQPGPEELECNTCCNFIKCEFEGHESIGWCSRYDEFVRACDGDDCWEER